MHHRVDLDDLGVWLPSQCYTSCQGSMSTIFLLVAT